MRFIRRTAWSLSYLLSDLGIAIYSNSWLPFWKSRWWLGGVIHNKLGRRLWRWSMRD